MDTKPTLRQLYGRNFYLPHPLMINSGTFWRCSHGITGMDGNGNMLGCRECRIEVDEAAAADTLLHASAQHDIHVNMEARFERERARFCQVLSLMGESEAAIKLALANLNKQIEAHPSGGLVLTHGPFEFLTGNPQSTFRNLIAMWWQDEDDGSQFNELLWEAPKAAEPDPTDWIHITFMDKPVLVHPDINVRVQYALLTAALTEFRDREALASTGLNLIQGAEEYTK